MIVLRLDNVTFSHPGGLVLQELSWPIQTGQKLGLVGPNGAGKTTFFNLLTGQYKATEGKVFFKGQDITNLGPAMRTRLGMGRSFQLTNIFPVLSVLENVRVAIQSRKGFGLNFWRNYLHFSETEDEAYALLEDLLQRPASALQLAQGLVALPLELFGRLRVALGVEGPAGRDRLVLDRVTASSAQLDKRFLLHTVEQPTITGPITAANLPIMLYRPNSRPACSAGIRRAYSARLIDWMPPWTSPITTASP